MVEHADTDLLVFLTPDQCLVCNKVISPQH